MAAPPGAPPMAHYSLLGLVCALVLGVYGWSAERLFVESQRPSEDNSYYNLLVDGFRVGQLNLNSEVPPALAQLDDRSHLHAKPSDAVDHHPLTDVSYYRGKLYLYFGVTPAVLLFWPYRELTGHSLYHKGVVLIFFSLGYLASVGLLCAVWRRYFAVVSVGIVAACALALGLANFVLLCLPRGGVYEVAISCGYALTMATLGLLWQALHATRGRTWWLVEASLGYGLAVGARPSLLLGAIILLVPVSLAWRDRAQPGQRPRTWTLLLGATGPITVIGLGLLLYNAVRFDDPFEFGQHYVLSWTGQQFLQPQDGVRLFSLAFFWYNFQAYFLAPAHWSGRFPFVHDLTLSSLPAGHRGTEYVFGVLAFLPLVWLALGAPLIWRGRRGDSRSALRAFGLVLLLLFGSCALTLCLFFAAYGRYQVEFLPALVWLAVLGILGLERALAVRPGWHARVRWGWGLLAALAMAFNGLATVAVASYLHVCRSLICLNRGQTDEAIVQFQKALSLQPDNAEAHNNFGAALFRQGRVAQAVGCYELALRVNPDFAEAHNNLGFALFQEGKVGEAIRHFELALRLRPDFVKAHRNMANALIQQGKVQEAVGHYEQVLRLEPDDAQAHNNLGFVLFQQGKVAEAILHYEQALRLKPDYAETHNVLGETLLQQGRVAEAIGHYEQALRLKPDFGQAHISLGVALFQQGRCAEAVGHLEQALRLKPGDAVVQTHLAWVLATCTDAKLRDGPRAVALAEGVNRLTGGKDPDILDTLAAAYAEAGRFGEAVRAAQTALDFANLNGQGELARSIDGRLKLYQAGRPYRQE